MALDCETLVIGAGPAGLTAAMYLARYRRDVLVVHDGTARALRIPLTHNVPGFPEGVCGTDLLARMTEHATEYGARLHEALVTGLERTANGFTAQLDDGGAITARGVVLATGIWLNEVDLPREVHEQAIKDDVLRYCPVCDAYEHSGREIAVLGADLHGAAEAMFLRQYSDKVTLIPAWSDDLDADQHHELDDSDITVLRGRVTAIEPDADGITVHLAGRDGTASSHRFGILYPAFGVTPRTDLAVKLGLEVDEDGRLGALTHMKAEIPGFYAAGDIVEGLDQISVAMGHGAVAATKLHNYLRDEDDHVMSDQRPVD